MMTFLLILFVMYWLPTIVAIVRQTPSALGIAAFNFFLGWTVIGWIMALVWALATAPAVQRVTVYVDGRRTEAEILR
ncbi:MAG TPA: superinfection immunity protein [Rhizomicrobium sp.]|nr:superinfection immunity protein [Rhizomicrobium sp.]